VHIYIHTTWAYVLRAAPLTMLTYAPLTLTFPFSLTTYLFVAHTLDVPEQALSASLLSGGVTALVGLFCVGLVKDTADTLYMCYCIDQNAGQRRRKEVFDAFEYETRRSQQTEPESQRPATQQPQTRQSPRVAAPQPDSTTPIRQHRLQSPIVVNQVRIPTPDPFEQSPVEDVEEGVEATRFDTSTTSLHGYRIEDESTTAKSLEKSNLNSSERSTRHDNANSDDEDGEESQLFPGSDLF